MRSILPISAALFLAIALACGGKTDTPETPTTPSVTPPAAGQAAPPLPTRWVQVSQKDGQWVVETPCEGDTRSIMLDSSTPTKITIGQASSAEGYNVTSTNYQNNTYTFTLVSASGNPAIASLTRGVPTDTWGFTTIEGAGSYVDQSKVGTLATVKAENCNEPAARTTNRPLSERTTPHPTLSQKHKLKNRK